MHLLEWSINEVLRQYHDYDPDGWRVHLSAVDALILAASPEADAEEWAIHDFEGFEGIELGESESFGRVSALASCIVEHGDAFAAFVNNGSVDEDDHDALADAFNEAYAGTYSSVEDYAQESTEECYDMKKLPEFLRYHIDWEGVARDMEQSGDIWTADGGRGVHVFRNV